MTVCQLLLLSLLTLACGSAPSRHHNATVAFTPEYLINIRDIANQTQEDIATILGPQSSLDPAKAAKSRCPNCQKYSYQDGTIEITYINDMADWITLFPPPGIPARQTPALLGLSDVEPDYIDSNVLRWKNKAGIRELITYQDATGAISSIQVFVTTP
jgi:hypothetical protein